jgi:hypothetical protein
VVWTNLFTKSTQIQTRQLDTQNRINAKTLDYPMLGMVPETTDPRPPTPDFSAKRHRRNQRKATVPPPPTHKALRSWFLWEAMLPRIFSATNRIKEREWKWISVGRRNQGKKFAQCLKARYRRFSIYWQRGLR